MFISSLYATPSSFFAGRNDCFSISPSFANTCGTWATVSKKSLIRKPSLEVKVSVSGTETEPIEREVSPAGTSSDEARRARRSADWKAARAYKESGAIYKSRIEGSNAGGLLANIHFGDTTHAEPYKAIQDIAKDLIGSRIFVKVIQASEESRKLIFSEKEAIWSQFSGKVKVGDIFDARVGSVEDYGAFVHLRFPDGCYHITGLVHVSEVSWDFVQDVRDVLKEGDEVRVKVMEMDIEKMRVTLSIKQLEDDPLLETLDKVISQDTQFSADTSEMVDGANIEPLPGLENICTELLQEDGITDVKICRQGFEKRVVSQDLQLWLSNEPATNNQMTLLARAGRQVQEVQLSTTLDQEGIKKALQRVLERVP